MGCIEESQAHPPETTENDIETSFSKTRRVSLSFHVQGGSNMTGTDLCVNKPHYAAAVRP
jgi:hypothetical protein